MLLSIFITIVTIVITNVMNIVIVNVFTVVTASYHQSYQYYLHCCRQCYHHCYHQTVRQQVGDLSWGTLVTKELHMKRNVLILPHNVLCQYMRLTSHVHNTAYKFVSGTVSMRETVLKLKFFS